MPEVNAERTAAGEDSILILRLAATAVVVAFIVAGRVPVAIVARRAGLVAGSRTTPRAVDAAPHPCPTDATAEVAVKQPVTSTVDDLGTPQPAFGQVEPLGRRRTAVRVAFVIGILALALLVRSSGVLSTRGAGTSLPPLPEVAAVAPGLVRGGQPDDIDLMRLRDDYGGRWVVSVDGMDIEEQAVARDLGLRTLQLNVPEDGVPSADEVLALVRFLRGTAADRSAGGGNGVVYLHDATGRGPVLVVTAVLKLLQGLPLPAVLRELSPHKEGGFNVQQLEALREVAGVVEGDAASTPRYATLRGVTW